MKENITSHITKGLIIALILIAINIVGQLTKLVYESWFGWIGLIVFLITVVASVIYFGKQLNENLTFGILFTHGFKTSAVVICILFLYTLLSVYIVFPDFVNKMMEQGVIQAKQQGKTEEELKQYLAIGKKVFLAGGLMVNLFIGALGSLIGSAIAKQMFNHHPTAK